ncbi:MAG TPA: alternative ribosome rescue aminoacyl-tRNA hydrolase ArfB [Gemmatimonadales bacterium]
MIGEDGLLEITPALRLPVRELTFRATPSGGPGGQHANRSSTRIELWWHVAASPSLTETQRTLVTARLGRRLDAEGRLRIVSAERRSQSQNREAAVARLVTLVAGALHVAPPRRRTRPTRGSIEERLAAKRRRAARKRDRRSGDGDE